MKIHLPNFNKSKRLNDLKEAMEITDEYSLPTMNLGRISLEEMKTLKTSAIDIKNIKDFIDPLDGTFEYKGQKVLLYIKEQRYHRFEGEIKYKYHLCYCETLDWMDSSGRFARYVVTQRTDGLFLVDIVNRLSGQYLKEDQLYKMNVCKNCLKSLIVHYPSEKLFKGFNHFNISDFIEKYNTRHHKKPPHSPHSQPKNKYPDNWDAISVRLREDAGYKCAQCYEDYSDKKSLLHVHHKDGYKWNIDPQNLVVLCLSCHSQEPGHEKLKNGFNCYSINRL